MSGPWEKYKAAEPVAEEGPWAKYKQPVEAEPESSLNPFAGASVGENLSAAYDTAKSLGGDLMDRVGSFTDSINPLTPLARIAGNAVGAALDPEKDYAQYVADDKAERAARDERTPGIYSLAGTVTNPVNKLAGLAGAATSVGVNAANNGLEAAALDSGDDAADVAKDAGIETALGLVGHGAGKVAGKVLDSDMYKALATKFGKKTLGGTRGQLEKLEVKSNDLDDSVKRLLDDENVFDTPFQSKNDLYEKILARRKQSGQAGADLFQSGANPANQADTYDQLVSKANEAKNRGQAEIASKLEREAGIMKDIDSNPLPNIGPRDKQAEMAVTELDPEIIKGRKTQLDDQAYGNKLQVDKNAAKVSGEVRDMQYGLMDDPTALKAENARYGDLLTAENLASKAAAGEISNGGGLINVAKKGIGATIGGTMGSAFGPAGTAGGAMLGGAAQSLLTDYGPQLATYGFNQTSKVLQNAKWAQVLGDAAKRGGAAGVGSAHFLLTQRDPEYRKAHQEDQEANKE